MEKDWLIDKFLPNFTFSESHEILVNCQDLRHVYQTAFDLDLAESTIIQTLFKLRGLPTDDLHVDKFIKAMGFSILAEDFPYERLLGYRHTNRIVPVKSPDDFISQHVGTKRKVVFGFHFKQKYSDKVLITTKTRVLCLGLKSRFFYTFYWYTIRPFSGLIRRIILNMIKTKVEK